MIINNKRIQSIWFDESSQKVMIIDQRRLPFKYEEIELTTFDEAFRAISDMIVRGAPLIGITAAYGIYLAIKNSTDYSIIWLEKQCEYLKNARPTAVNLQIIIDYLLVTLKETPSNEWAEISLKLARHVEAMEIENCSKIGDFGLSLIESIWEKKQSTVNILTHCNAGWLACGKWGTATAPIYKAHLKGIPVHVWVDETRPRNQGARLTAWELNQANVPFTVIPDNTGGHLMQHHQVDLVIVGSDRTTLNGDVANKIGTYLKALAAYDNQIPFYVALPTTSIDFEMEDGIKNIPIEERNGSEVLSMETYYNGKVNESFLMPKEWKVANYGFDVTPARLITALITEKGICGANKEEISKLALSASVISMTEH